MKNSTRRLVHQYNENYTHAVNAHLPSTEAITSITEEFVVPEKIAQIIESDVLARSMFLQKITVLAGLEELMGKKFSFDIPGDILKRTQVSDTVQRGPTITATFAEDTYGMTPIEADAYFDYQKLDAWAKLGGNQFANLIRGSIRTAIANNRLKLGFQGVARDESAGAVATANNVDKGWIHHVREDRPANLVSEQVAGSGKVFIGDERRVGLSGDAVNVGSGVVGLPSMNHGFKAGAQIHVSGTSHYNGSSLVKESSTAHEIHIEGTFQVETLSAPAQALQVGDYKNIHALANQMKWNIPDEKQGDLVAIISRDLFADKEGKLYEEYGGVPSEKNKIALALGDLGGLPQERPPFMPANTLMVTPLKNLAIYLHKEWRQSFKEDESKNGMVFWNRFSQDYVVQDYDQIMISENIHSIYPG